MNRESPLPSELTLERGRLKRNVNRPIGKKFGEKNKSKQRLSHHPTRFGKTRKHQDGMEKDLREKPKGRSVEGEEANQPTRCPIDKKEDINTGE